MIVPNRRPAAFSLVELLVVIAIIGLLVALLIPAVQQARESGRRIQCVNNLKQIGLAYQCHETSYHALPPAYISDPTKPVGWGIFLLPYIELRTVYDQYNFNAPFYQTNPAAEIDNQRIANMLFPVFACPSSPYPVERKPYDYTFSYPGYPSITWQAAAADYSPIEGIAPELDSYLSLNYTANQRKGVLEPDKKVPMDAIQDGTSHTILITEIMGKNDLWQNGRNQQQKITGQYTGQGGWADTTSAASKFVGCTPDGSIAPGPCGINISNEYGLFSLHRIMVNSLIADGSVQSEAADIDIRVLVGLLTRAGFELEKNP
jgi:prepilin-type N-terminal cleavage/methylation domain-containing protein